MCCCHRFWPACGVFSIAISHSSYDNIVSAESLACLTRYEWIQSDVNGNFFDQTVKVEWIHVQPFIFSKTSLILPFFYVWQWCRYFYLSATSLSRHIDSKFVCENYNLRHKSMSENETHSLPTRQKILPKFVASGPSRMHLIYDY